MQMKSVIVKLSKICKNELVIMVDMKMLFWNDSVMNSSSKQQLPRHRLATTVKT